MRLRPALLTAVAALVVLPGAAHAATSCNLVKDGANDAAFLNPASPVKSAAFDIRSMDVASGKKTFVVVLRMATTKYADEPAAKLGMTFDVTFKIAKVDHRFTRKVGNDGKVTDTATQGGKPIPGLAVKMDGTTITWTVPRGGMPKLKKNVVLSDFYTNTSAPTATYDMAPDGGYASLAEYRDGQKSCVKAA